MGRRDPDLQGPAGRAWDVPFPKDKDGTHAGLSTWIVNVPGAHPFWSWWAIHLIHLRELEGFPPAKKQYPEAEYEFLITAINPEQCPEPDPDIPGYPFLEPVDVCEHFHGIIDADAIRICRLAVRAIVDGHLSPDQDFRPAWKNTIQTTVSHYRQGKHAVQ